MQPIRLTVNGSAHELLVHPAASLLSVLRDGLKLMGTKEGCGTGYCGACTVLVDGDPVNACLYFAVDADGRAVTTIEGLEADNPVQAAFVACSGLQCGYCTPGMVMSAVSLLEEQPHADERRVREGLAGNICRCTGYQSIVQSVMQAATTMRERGQTAITERRVRVRARA